MKQYAIVKDGKVTGFKRTSEPDENMVECNKPIYVNGVRYPGNIPKEGYSWDGEKFSSE